MKFYLKCIIGKLIEFIEYIQYNNCKIIDNKFIDSQNIDDNILTDSGYEHTSKIYKTKPYDVYILTLDNDITLECADNHIVFANNYEEIFVKDLTLNDYVITDKGKIKVKSIKKMPYKLCMYDLTIDSDNHRYYTNGILSHNTTTLAACLAWFLCFNDSKNVMVLANKQATAIEIVDKIIQIFRGLPYWLKPGSLNFGKMGLTLDNGCKLLSSATTASTSIGFTIHWLLTDEFAHIPKNIIEPFWRSVYPTLSSSKLSRCTIISTPNGQNMFYDIYSKSSMGTGENSFKGMRIDYWQVPEHNDEWAEQMRRDFGAELFAQEFELQFTVNSKMLLRASDFQFMNKIQQNFISHEFNYSEILSSKQMRWHPLFNVNNISPTDKFLFSIDIAEGKEYEDEIKETDKQNDYNIINIFKIIPNSIANIRSKNGASKIELKDCFKLVQVGIYECNEHDEEVLAQITDELLYKVFDADINDNVRLMIEMNFQGKNFVNILKKHECFYDDIIIKTYHSAPLPGEKHKKKYGYKTTATKEIFIKKGAKLINKKRIIVSDNDSIKQLAAFGKVKNGYGGIAAHDDISMTILNAIPRALDENVFIDWCEDVINIPENAENKSAINQLIQKWEIENSDISDSNFKSIYASNTNNAFDTHNTQILYSTLMRH